jgi:hypothetical protein
LKPRERLVTKPSFDKFPRQAWVAVLLAFALALILLVTASPGWRKLMAPQVLTDIEQSLPSGQDALEARESLGLQLGDPGILPPRRELAEARSSHAHRAAQ